MKIIMLFIGLLLSSILYSQPPEYSAQLIGANAYLKFPGAINTSGSQLNTSEGCASICDNSGNLLFYSDGVRVWDKTNTQMPNGFGLLGHPSSTQSCLIIKQPGNLNLYYIFTVTQDNAVPSMVRYSIVNINANGGLGDIIAKNIPLGVTTTEKIGYTYHCNNIDIWVVTKDKGNNYFRSFLVTSAGVNPMVSSIVPYVLPTTSGTEVIGCMKISPDGGRLAICHYGANTVFLYRFNAQLGTVTGETLLSNTFVGPYGCEFSENNRYLYIGYNNGNNIHRYDLFNISPSTTRTSIATTVGTFMGSFQRIGLDIYIAQKNLFSLNTITNANTGGTYNANSILLLNQSNFGLNPVLEKHVDITIINTN
jgi:hypothetical protein